MLDAHPDAAMAYGDIIGVAQYGQVEGPLYKHAEYQQNESDFMRSFYGSCFPMWKATAHARVGYFDEQFGVAGDFDFQIRLARAFALAKTPGILGLYLDGDLQKLTRSSDRLHIERTAIEYRYAIFDKLDLTYLARALRAIEIDHLLWYDQRHDVASWFDSYNAFWRTRLYLLPLCLMHIPRSLVHQVKASVANQRSCTSSEKQKTPSVHG